MPSASPDPGYGVRAPRSPALRVLVEAGRRAGHRDLLADDGPYRYLEAVDRAGYPYPWLLGNERRERRVRRERLVDGDRVRVQVEQAPAARHGRSQVAQVGQAQVGGH